ncbi:hypothetical protein DL93DRAFT_2169882 [Clavulina sp. PMI_390]|nr:hypothetical protein DL93DRAFT_2169882 [Clavulina sp. PMI_390]
MLCSTSVFAAFLLAVVSSFAAPATLEARDSPACVTYKSGYLATELIDGSWYPYSLNSDAEFIYTSPPGAGISVQFQTCTPTYAGAANDPDDSMLYGRIYVPSSKSCVIVDTDASIARLVSCLDSADGAMTTGASPPQNFALHNDGISLYWYGAGDVSLSRPSYGSCTGYYAYLHGSQFANPPDYTPVVDERNLVQYACEYKNADATIFAALRPTPSGSD